MQKRPASANAGPTAPTDSGGLTGPPRLSVTRTPAGAPASFGNRTSGHNSAVRHSHGVLGIPGASTATQRPSASGPSKKQRKERLPNWGAAEILALVEAKRILNLEETLSIDGRDLMTPDMNKWQRISADVMRARVSQHHRDGGACKSKWNQIIPEYKRLVDFFARTGNNSATYWTMDRAEKKTEGLPKSFSEEVFYRIHEWYGRRPAVQPPHTRDLMSADDMNFEAAEAEPTGIPHDNLSADIDEDNLEGEFDMADSDDVSLSTHSPSVPSAPARRGVHPTLSRMSPSCSAPPAPKSNIPAGVTPHLISSSDTSHGKAQHRSANTAVKRKNVSGHSLIVDATRATGDAMSGQLKQFADSSRQVEESKIEIHMKLFAEQMMYQRDRDRRLHESARQANENAKLSIEKQVELVQCLANLAFVLSSGQTSSDSPPLNSSAANPVNAGLDPLQRFHSALQSHEDRPPSAADDKDIPKD